MWEQISFFNDFMDRALFPTSSNLTALFLRNQDLMFHIQGFLFGFGICCTPHMSRYPSATGYNRQLVAATMTGTAESLQQVRCSGVFQSSHRIAYIFLLLTIFFSLHKISNMPSYAKFHYYFWKKDIMQFRLNSNLTCI